MNHLVFLTFFCGIFFSGNISAQSPDSLMTKIKGMETGKTAKIAAARQELKTAFEQEDFGLVNAWLGFLENDLATDDYATTDFDERWMLYFWTNNYSQLFNEVADYERLRLEKYQFQNPPPEDSLFNLVDKFTFQNRYELYSNLRTNFLSEEEQALAAMLVDYLLREDAKPENRKSRNQKSEAFLKKYPNSRFRKFVYKNLYNEMVYSKNVWGGDILGVYGRADGALGVNFRPFWGGEFAVLYGRKKWSGAFRARFGAHDVRRSFYERNALIAPDSSAFLVDLGLDFGYQLAETDKLKIWPSVGFGFSILSVSDSPNNPDLSQKEVFSSPFFAPALNLGVKFAEKLNETPPTLRFRIGYKIQNFEKKNVELAGNQVFIAAGIGFSGRTKTKKKI